jgi:predicted ATPase
VLTRVEITNYKCLADVKVDLTPLHAIVGPNDSGKTSFLEAVAALVNVRQLGSKAFPPAWDGRELASAETGAESVTFSATLKKWRSRSTTRFTQQIIFPENGQELIPKNILFEPDSREAKIERAKLGPALLFHFHPPELARPSAWVDEKAFPMDIAGHGLPTLLDEILGKDRDRFVAMEKEFCELFPRYSRIVLEPAKATYKVIRQEDGLVEYKTMPGKRLRLVARDDEWQVSAAHVSSGVLIVLAILAIKHQPSSPSVVLIEEPENSIHPGLLGELVRLVREISERSVKAQKGPQVILASHSPYLLDHLEAEEVTLFTREPNGATRTLRMSDSERVQHMLKHFHLGEVWTQDGEEKLMEMAAQSEAEAQ